MAPIDKAANHILETSPIRARLGLVLGSGFDQVHSAVKPLAEMPYRALPGFIPPTVPGHAGKLILGYLAELPVIVLRGRAHYYEGHSLDAITFPIRVLARCGIEQVLLTNAAGGINRRYRAGDFMCVADHLNCIGANPLRGLISAGESGFLDLSQTYDPELIQILLKEGKRLRLRMHSGVYAAVSGPCYETPAEVRALASLGADAVGMSTVPEAIVARHCGLRVAAISCITNAAAGFASSPISHGEVMAAAEQVANQATALAIGFARSLHLRLAGKKLISTRSVRRS